MVSTKLEANTAPKANTQKRFISSFSVLLMVILEFIWRIYSFEMHSDTQASHALLARGPRGRMQSKALTNSRATDVNALGSFIVEGASSLAATPFAEWGAFAAETGTCLAAGKRRNAGDREHGQKRQYQKQFED